MHYAQLRAFHAVAEYAGFTAAAQALNVTQPALSDQVRRLEQEFGVTLFNRRPRTVEPTELGRRLLAATRQMFGCERDARAILASAGALASGSLTIAADAPDLAMRLIAAFRMRHPGIVVSLAIANAEACTERVLSSAVDVAITAARQVDSRLEVKVLRREPLVAMVPRSNPLAARTCLKLAELVLNPLVFREARSTTQRLLEEDLARLGLSVEPVILVEGREAALEAVAHGIGLGVIARAEFNGDRRIAIVPIDDSRAAMVEALVRLADRPPSRLLDALFRTEISGNEMTASSPPDVGSILAQGSSTAVRSSE